MPVTAYKTTQRYRPQPKFTPPWKPQICHCHMHTSEMEPESILMVIQITHSETTSLNCHWKSTQGHVWNIWSRLLIFCTTVSFWCKECIMYMKWMQYAMLCFSFRSHISPLGSAERRAVTLWRCLLNTTQILCSTFFTDLYFTCTTIWELAGMPFVTYRLF
jgi:hypothetical protein